MFQVGGVCLHPHKRELQNSNSFFRNSMDDITRVCLVLFVKSVIQDCMCIAEGELQLTVKMHTTAHPDLRPMGTVFERCQVCVLCCYTLKCLNVSYCVCVVWHHFNICSCLPSEPDLFHDLSC